MQADILTHSTLAGRLRALAVIPLRALIIVLLTACAAGPAWAQSPARFCARAGTDDTLRPIPASLVPEINTLFHTSMPPGVATRMTVFRCAGGQVLVCGMGANLPCGKADTSRSTSGGAAWCRDHPNADFIPAYATGHASIYDWRCHDGAAVIVRRRYQVDPRGFIAEYWKRLPAAAANK